MAAPFHLRGEAGQAAAQQRHFQGVHVRVVVVLREARVVAAGAHRGSGEDADGFVCHSPEFGLSGVSPALSLRRINGHKFGERALVSDPTPGVHLAERATPRGARPLIALRRVVQ